MGTNIFSLTGKITSIAEVTNGFTKTSRFYEWRTFKIRVEDTNDDPLTFNLGTKKTHYLVGYDIGDMITVFFEVKPRKNGDAYLLVYKVEKP